MILGIGSDIVHIERIQVLLDRFSGRFEKHVYTEDEINNAVRFSPSNVRGRAAYFARRFAAKEAFAKALGTGFRNGLIMRDIGVVNNVAGKPNLILSGHAQTFLQDLAKGKKVFTHLSLSDDYAIAQAFVIISTE